MNIEDKDYLGKVALKKRLEKGALNPTVYITYKDIKQYQFQDRPLRDTTGHQPSPGYRAVDHNCLAVIFH